MRKSVQVGLVAAAALFAVATVALFVTYRDTATRLAETKAVEQEVRQDYSETIDAIAEIQDSLNTISLGDTSVSGRAWNRETGQKLAQPTGRDALDRIALVRASISRSRDRINALEADLKDRGVKVAGLQRMVNQLKRTVGEKEELVAQLETRVHTLETEVTGLATTVQQTQDTLRVRDESLERTRRELATVYYAIGSKDQLEDAGIIESKGGVLGIGKTVQPSPTASQTAFVPLDTDHERVVYIGNEKARVISAQPSSSYQLTLVSGQMELHILDPDEFRKIKQLVILTG